RFFLISSGERAAAPSLAPGLGAALEPRSGGPPGFALHGWRSVPGGEIHVSLAELRARTCFCKSSLAILGISGNQRLESLDSFEVAIDGRGQVTSLPRDLAETAIGFADCLAGERVLWIGLR